MRVVSQLQCRVWRRTNKSPGAKLYYKAGVEEVEEGDSRRVFKVDGSLLGQAVSQKPSDLTGL